MSHTLYSSLFFHSLSRSLFSFFFFFNDTATTEIYTLSLHDALPICADGLVDIRAIITQAPALLVRGGWQDRKSTRLNSSHTVISYAVFCLKKKKNRIGLSKILADIRVRVADRVTDERIVVLYDDIDS